MITIHYFYMKGCPHCVTTNPEWKKLRKHFRSERKQKKISFKKTESKKITPALRKQFSIEGFPTIVMYIQEGDKYLHLKPFEEDRTFDKLREFITQYQETHQSAALPSSTKKQPSHSHLLHYVPKSRWIPPTIQESQKKYPSSLLEEKSRQISSSDSSTVENTDDILKKVIDSIESDIDDLSEEESEEEEENMEEDEEDSEDKTVTSPQDSYVSQFTELDTEPSSESPNLYQYLDVPIGPVTHICSKQGTHSLKNLMKSFYQKMSNTQEPSVDSLFDSEDHSQINSDSNSSYQIPYQYVESSLLLPSRCRQSHSPEPTQESVPSEQIKPKVISIDVITPPREDTVSDDESSLSSEETTSSEEEPIIDLSLIHI